MHPKERGSRRDRSSGRRLVAARSTVLPQTKQLPLLHVGRPLYPPPARGAVAQRRIVHPAEAAVSGPRLVVRLRGLEDARRACAEAADSAGRAHERVPGDRGGSQDPLARRARGAGRSVRPARASRVSEVGQRTVARRSNVDGFMPVRSRDAPTRDSKCFVSVSMAVGVETRHVRTRLCTCGAWPSATGCRLGGWC